MEPKRTLHSGNLVRGVHAGDRKLFMEKWGKRIIIARDYKEMAKMREWRADRA